MAVKISINKAEFQSELNGLSTNLLSVSNSASVLGILDTRQSRDTRMIQYAEQNVNCMKRINDYAKLLSKDLEALTDIYNDKIDLDEKLAAKK